MTEAMVRVLQLEAELETLRAENARQKKWIERAVELIAIMGGSSTLDAPKSRALVREVSDNGR